MESISQTSRNKWIQASQTCTKYMEPSYTNTKFCHCVDDFGIKYYNKEDTNHLLSSLKDNYDITMDWNRNNNCG